MSYKLNWYIPGHILYAQYWGETTVEELRQSLQEINMFIDQSRQKQVHIISDVSRVSKSLSLVNITGALEGYKASERTGWSITIGEKDTELRFASNITRQMLKVRQRAFATLEEALDFLKHTDPAIDWSQADLTALTQPPGVAS